jgi:hypothetical protein
MACKIVMNSACTCLRRACFSWPSGKGPAGMNAAPVCPAGLEPVRQAAAGGTWHRGLGCTAPPPGLWGRRWTLTGPSRMVTLERYYGMEFTNVNPQLRIRPSRPALNALRRPPRRLPENLPCGPARPEISPRYPAGGRCRTRTPSRLAVACERSPDWWPDSGTPLGPGTSNSCV